MRLKGLFWWKPKLGDPGPSCAASSLEWWGVTCRRGDLLHTAFPGPHSSSDSPQRSAEPSRAQTEWCEGWGIHRRTWWCPGGSQELPRFIWPPLSQLMRPRYNQSPFMYGIFELNMHFPTEAYKRYLLSLKYLAASYLKWSLMISILSLCLFL